MSSENKSVASWIGAISLLVVVGMFVVRHEYPGLRFSESLYCVLRLFFFEINLADFPKSKALIALVFVAPLVTASAIGAAVTYLFRLSPFFSIRGMSDHAIVCGVGSTGKLLAEILKNHGMSVVGIDLGPAELFDDWRAHTKVPILWGDFHSGPLLEKAGASRARAIIFASGEDLSNLEGATGAYERLKRKDGPVQLIWTHIADENLANTAREAIRTEGVVNIRIFDTYRIAATRLIGTLFGADARKGVREVMLIGFGKFGRDLFETIARDLRPGEDFNVKIVDRRDRSRAVEALAESLGISSKVSFEMSAIQEIKLPEGRDRAWFLCTDDDLGNIAAALSLSSRSRGSKIFARVSHWPLSAISDHLGQEKGVVFVNINDLVEGGIEQMPGMLKPAGLGDLKRLKND